MTINMFNDKIKITEGLIVAVGGFQSGKSTLLKQYSDNGFEPVSFADPLRELAWILQGYKPKDYEKYKRCVIGLDHLPEFISKTLIRIFPLLLTGRKFLQYLGDGMRKIFGDDFWIKRFLVKALEILKTKKKARSDDCRYPNELDKCHELINEFGGMIIFANYNSGGQNPKDPHISELMAQIFLDMGLKHGDIIDLPHIEEMKNRYAVEIIKRKSPK